jgi:hypothetical protein
MNWNILIRGKYCIDDVLIAVKEESWQKTRKSMLRTSLRFKYNTLLQWLIDHEFDERSSIQVTNYVHALKRGGLLKLEHNIYRPTR